MQSPSLHLSVCTFFGIIFCLFYTNSSKFDVKENNEILKERKCDEQNTDDNPKNKWTHAVGLWNVQGDAVDHVYHHKKKS